MIEDTIRHVEAIDRDLLNQMVRLDQHCPDFQVETWSVRRLSDQGIVNPEGLFRLDGHGNIPSLNGAGQRDWSLVLKMIKKTDLGREPRKIWYWRREVELIQSGVLERLPGPVVTPRFYGVQETEDEAWIWMEYIRDEFPSRWTAEDFLFAARQFGLMDGAYLTGHPLTSFSGMCTEHCRGWYDMLFFFPFGYDINKTWDDPMIQKLYAGDLERRAKRARAEIERFFDAQVRLPQVFGHFDTQRRNLMIRSRADGQRELVAIDWAMSGQGPVGGNLAMMVPNSVWLADLDFSALWDIEPAAYQAYLQALRESGWQGSEDLVRLGYCSWTFPGVIFPELTYTDVTEQNFAEKRAQAEFFLAQAEEALDLMDRLGIA